MWVRKSFREPPPYVPPVSRRGRKSRRGFRNWSGRRSSDPTVVVLNSTPETRPRLLTPGPRRRGKGQRNTRKRRKRSLRRGLAMRVLDPSLGLLAPLCLQKDRGNEERQENRRHRTKRRRGPVLWVHDPNLGPLFRLHLQDTRRKKCRRSSRRRRCRPVVRATLPPILLNN